MLYLIPILLVTHKINFRTGIFFSILASCLWLYSDLATGHMYTHPLFLYWNMLVRLIMFLSVAYFFSVSRKKEEELDEDFLTGLLNLRGLLWLLDHEVERCKRYKRPFTLAYIDCDNFKKVNDQFGHASGDRLLKSIASTLVKAFRSADVLARLGGDEFVVLMPETGLEAAKHALKHACALLDVYEKHVFPVTLSIGALSFSTAPRSSHEALTKADQLMYTVKRNGKSAFRIQEVAK